MHPSLLMGLIATGFVSMRSWGHRRTMIVACLLVAAFVQAALREAPFLQSPYPRIRAQAEEIEQKLTGLSAIGARELTDGTLVYFGMTKAAEGAGDRFERLLIAAPNPIP